MARARRTSPSGAGTARYFITLWRADNERCSVSYSIRRKDDERAVFCAQQSLVKSIKSTRLIHEYFDSYTVERWVSEDVRETVERQRRWGKATEFITRYESEEWRKHISRKRSRTGRKDGAQLSANSKTAKQLALPGMGVPVTQRHARATTLSPYRKRMLELTEAARRAVESRRKR